MSGLAQTRPDRALAAFVAKCNEHLRVFLSVCRLPTAPSPALFICLSAACIYSHSAKKFALIITQANTDPFLKLSLLLLLLFIPTKAK